MNIAKLVFAFVLKKPLTWAFHVLTLALGVGVVVAVVLLGQALDNRFSRDLAGIDLVVGAKGSPLQLIMSSLFQLDVPTGNIPLATAERISNNPLVALAVPISMGDNVGGVRIVGTTPAYGDLYHARIIAGEWWRAPMQVVLGAEAARTLRLHLGDSFVGQHGLSTGGESHAETPYVVVGLLAPTGAVVDRLALTSTESVWRVHEHHDAEHEEAESHVEAGEHAHEGANTDEDHHESAREVTALLVRYKSAMGAVMLPRFVAAMPDIQAAIPAIEAGRLNVLLGTGADVLRAFGIGLLVLSALGFFVALFAAVQQRQRELVLLRALGARRTLLLAVVALEATLLGALGGALGIALGRIAGAVAAHSASANGGPLLTLPPLGTFEVSVFLFAALLSLAAALAPAIVAARVDPSSALKGG